MRRRPLRAVLLLVALALVAAPVGRPRAHAADAGLVLEALRILRARYVDSVEPTPLLNGALAGVRAALSAAGVAAEVPELASPGEAADAAFRARFEAAAAAASGRLTRTALTYAAIRGMTATLRDSHTGFLTPEANRERQLRQRGQAGFTGAGIVLLERDGRFYVRDVIPDGPALRAGVQRLDRIARIDGISTLGLQVEQVAGSIRGPAGTAVTLVLDRPGRADPVTVSLVRAPIQVPAVFEARVLPGGVGYLHFYQFTARSGREFRAALDRLLASGARALVLDVRANVGGYVHELSAVLSALLPAGRPILRETSRGGRTRTVYTAGRPALPPGLPVVVLVDDATASAAELLAAALREHLRARVVGTRTSGAVEASIVVDLSDGSALSVTVQRLSTGLGYRLEGVGVQPDLSIALTGADLDRGQDTQLLRALAVAREGARPAAQPRSAVGGSGRTP
ncbi:MAG: S41 family peptidase [Armatimonadota bacterium]|nr:S41 family peptidase [Armatimonadota bacterium]MDR7532502.1 S41 family peptidase [Armatimonadota bacterium]MDR7535607.1 S41 family peptidase [Armatimonadota bacterium]